MKTNPSSQAKKSLYPTWFPYPTSWLKAFVLALFLTVLARVFSFTEFFGYWLARLVNSPAILFIFLILALLSPIVAIAVTHHIFHRVVGKFLPSIQAPELGELKGLKPGLVSWWEGLFGWLVIALSTLTTLSVLILIIPLFDLEYHHRYYYHYYWYNYYWDSDYWHNYYWDNTNLLLCCEITWIVCAALIYQIEYLFKRKLISIYANNLNPLSSNPSKNQLDHSPNSVDVELNRLRGDLGSNQIKKGKESSPAPSPSSPSNQSTRKILSNKLIILPLLFSLVVGGIYLFSKVLPSRENTLSPTTISSVQPTITPTATPTEKPQLDSFQEAVNNALSAAKLTQVAKSKEDWNQVAQQWQKAIALMQSVPSSSSNYAVAQKKAVEYQRNIDYAKAAAENLH